MMFRPGNIGHLGRLGLVAGMQPSLVTQALAILAKYGSAANLYLPGVGAISGITAGNWLDSAGATAASVDGQVGRVDNARGGANLTQSTAANRPILRRGLVNQLLWSGDFSNAAWVKTNTTVVANAAADHEGVVAADKLVATATSGVHAVQQTVTLAAGVHSYVVRAKAGEYGWLAISMDGTTFAYYNLSTGAVGTVGAGHSAFISEAGNGYYDCIATFTFTAGAKTIFHNIASANNTASFTGNGTNGVFLASAALFTGTVTAQQIIDAGGIPLTTTAPASSTNGPYAWDFVSNDSFTSTMTPGNAGFFCASANVTDSGVLRTFLGAGAGSDASSGVWLARQVSSNLLMLQVGNGTTRNSIGAPYPVATNAVASAGWDGSAMFVGINGTETSGAKTVDCTSSNTMNIGVLTGTTNPMLGTIGATIIMPTVLPTATERATLRKFIASLSGVTL